MQRIIIVGKTGSGKTTLARQLAQRLNLEAIELDSIYWGPRWTPIPVEDYKAAVELRTRAARWAVDGNYRQVRPYVWGRADTLVWLDYPLWLVWWRITTRTLRRSARRELLWGNNLERPWDLISRDSLLLWALKTHRRHRADYPALLQQPEYQHLKLFRFTTPQATQQWLKQLTLNLSPP